jgi:hypothetical protein
LAAVVILAQIFHDCGLVDVEHVGGDVGDVTQDSS